MMNGWTLLLVSIGILKLIDGFFALVEYLEHPPKKSGRSG